jgi:hypothetical protein
LLTEDLNPLSDEAPVFAIDPVCFRSVLSEKQDQQLVDFLRQPEPD